MKLADSVGVFDVALGEAVVALVVDDDAVTEAVVVGDGAAEPVDDGDVPSGAVCVGVGDVAAHGQNRCASAPPNEFSTAEQSKSPHAVAS